MKIVAAIIGMGIGQKHLEAIDNYKNISFSKYDNFFNKKYSYEEYYNNIKDYIIHH